MRQLKIVVDEEAQVAPQACLLKKFGTDKEAREEFKKGFHGVTHITDVIKDELLERANTNLLSTKKKDYTDGWGYRQAEQDAYARAVLELITLLP